MIIIKEFLKFVDRGEVPSFPLCIPPSRYYDTEIFEARRECITKGMWAIVDLHWTKFLVDWIGSRRVLEVMAGAGWLAKALTIHGCDIVATDSGAWEAAQHKEAKLVFPIEKLGGIQAVEKYHDRDILLISWPPYNDQEICEICERWTKTIIYIGELEDGCCAPHEFFDNFRIEEDANTLHIPFPSWPFIHDTICIGYYDSKGKVAEEHSKNNCSSDNHLGISIERNDL